MSYLFAFSYCPWDSCGKNTGVVHHSLLQWSTFFIVTRPSWVTLHCMAYNFIEFCKSLCDDKTVIHEGVVGVHNLFSVIQGFWVNVTSPFSFFFFF